MPLPPGEGVARPARARRVGRVDWLRARAVAVRIFCQSGEPV
ncbi:hypothetical protein [Planobispora siamensis]|nr:hypothetical protein [Planobispora siamensis]